MRYVRLRINPDRSLHPIYRYVDASSEVRRCSIVQWNARDPTELVVVYRVEGGRQGFTDTLDAADEVLEHDVVSASGDTFYSVIHTKTPEPMEELWRMATREAVVLLPPLVQRDDGAIDTRVIGSSGDLAEMMEDVPDWVEYEVDSVREAGGWRYSAYDRLSPRQRRALDAAHDLGYYDVPRRATHADVAEELGCSKSTASEHLRKAEAHLVRDAVRDRL